MTDARKNYKVVFHFMIILVSFILLNFSAAQSTESTFYSIQLNDDTINPVTAQYIIDTISLAEKDQARGVIIYLDTPGGLLSSTRLIVKKMLTAEVPIIVYIAPSGSRAGSAGVFITYASHIAAMAPSTNIGAAHPVKMGDGRQGRSKDWRELKDLIDELKFKNAGDLSDEEREKDISTNDKEESPLDENPMESKILNDTVAFIKAIAKKRGRNVEWGIKSVKESASITEEEALEIGVIEMIAGNQQELLEKMDGKIMDLNGREYLMESKGASVKEIKMDARQKFFNILANPNIAYFLMILGFYGLLYEITHPGIGVPGIMGVIFLILAFYSMQTLPTNYAGVALVILGLLLLVSEAFVPGFGLLTLGGLVCLILGSLLLFDTTDPIMKVSYAAIAAFSVTTVLISVFVVGRAVNIRHSRIQGGSEGLIGQVGEVEKTISAGQKGKVFVHGELWNAFSDETINKGEGAVVEKVEGLSLKVKRKV